MTSGWVPALIRRQFWQEPQEPSLDGCSQLNNRAISKAKVVFQFLLVQKKDKNDFGIGFEKLVEKTAFVIYAHRSLTNSSN